MQDSHILEIGGVIFYCQQEAAPLFKSFLQGYPWTQEQYSQMAEYLLGRLDEEKTILGIEDVTALRNAMSDVTKQPKVALPDAHQDPEPVHQEAHTETQQPIQHTIPQQGPTEKRIYRDRLHKMVGGVFAGIGNKYHIDPIWMRVMACALFLVMWQVGNDDGSSAISFLLIFGYGVAWALIPEAPHDYEYPSIKPLHKGIGIIAGVAQGISNYLGVPAILVRLLFFILLTYNGIGLLLYILLWILMPKQPRIPSENGEQPTDDGKILDAWDRQLKEEYKESDHPLRRLVIKVLKLGVEFLQFLGGRNHRLAWIYRIPAGLLGTCLVIASIFMIIALSIAFGVAYMGFDADALNGLNTHLTIDGVNIDQNFMLLSIIRDSIPDYLVVLTYVLGVMTTLVLGYIGISLIRWKASGNWKVATLVAASWLATAIALSIGVGMEARGFQVKGSASDTLALQLQPLDTLTVDILHNGDIGINRATLDIQPSENGQARVEIIYTAKGKNVEEAAVNARTLQYELSLDSIQKKLTLPTSFAIRPGLPFRDQHTTVRVYLPEGVHIRVPSDIGALTLEGKSHAFYDYEGGTWVWRMQEGELVAPLGQNIASMGDTEPGEDGKKNINSFEKLVIKGGAIIEITEGEAPSIQLDPALDHIKIRQEGGTLYIENPKQNINLDDDNKIILTTGNLENLLAEGAGSITLKGQRSGALHASIKGAFKFDYEGDASLLDISAEGMNKMTLDGKADELQLRIKGMGQCDGEGFMAQKAKILAEGMNQVSIGIAEQADIIESPTSMVDIIGNPSHVTRKKQ